MKYRNRKRDKRIIKAIEKTVADFHGSIPAIYQHFFFGAYHIAPQYLAIWYLFKTDKELQTAKENGLCEQLIEATITNLVSAGYPAEAFSAPYVPPNAKIPFENAASEQEKSMMDKLFRQTAGIYFTTKEAIDREAHGDYHLYFQ